MITERDLQTRRIARCVLAALVVLAIVGVVAIAYLVGGSCSPMLP
jgi:hypothetical protein